MGRQDSVEWNGGMEWWNGTVEWNSGITTPVEWSFPDDLYPISDNGLVRSRHNIMESVVLRSGKVSECQDGAQGDWLNPLGTHLQPCEAPIVLTSGKMPGGYFRLSCVGTSQRKHQNPGLLQQ